ncbi:MAG: hypothetical protein HOC71_00245 [Candidatus Latescibacteria bacterium]|nr:hypothetical protein [Candidatus Latescibacterota bacterium]
MAVAKDEYDVVFEDDDEEEEAAPTYKYLDKREQISPEAFRKIQESRSAVLLDVRGKAEMKFGVIRDSINIPIYVLDKEYTKLPRDKQIIVFCDTAMRAVFGYDMLIAKGFTKLKLLNHPVRFSKDGSYKIIEFEKKDR